MVSKVLFPVHEWVKGHPTYPILGEMLAAERLSVAELEQLRRQKLCSFVEYCYAHVPYVRTLMADAGIRPAQIRDPEDLALLPVMRKADVRANPDRLRSEIAGKLASFSSGGSTGEPLVFDLSKRRIASRVACRQRVSHWWGVSAGVPELAIWGSPLELKRQDRVRSIRDWVMAARLLSAYELNEVMMSRYLEIIASGRWRQIFAYPSAIYLLCLHAQKLGISLRKSGIRVIFVTSEVLYPHQRDLITEVFACPVANGYGGRDSGFIAHECPQGGMHVMADAVIAEIVDAEGRPVPPGEAGEIVVTDLYSEEVPFIRYATGDIGVASKRLCPCGRSLPLLESLDGRSNDAVVTADGRVMHGQSLVGLMMEVEGIEQFRIYQKDFDRFHLQIVSNQRYRSESEGRIRQTWSDRLRTPLQVTFEYLSQLPTERSGKLRHIVSELPAGRGLRNAQNAHISM
jgi:phenylacetate-CoA ligase